MYIKFIVLCVLFLNGVKSDCEGSRCDFTQDLFKSDIIKNASLTFNSSQDGLELLKVFDNAARFIKEETNKAYEIDKESEVFKHVEDEIKVLVKIFQLKDFVKSMFENAERSDSEKSYLFNSTDSRSNINESLNKNVVVNKSSTIQNVNASRDSSKNIENTTTLKQNETLNENISLYDKILTKNITLLKTGDTNENKTNQSENATPNNTETSLAINKTTINIDKPTQRIEVTKKHNLLDDINANIQDNEILDDYLSYFDLQDDNATDYPIIDYIELYKDTTNEDVDYISTAVPTLSYEEVTEKNEFEDYELLEDFNVNNSGCQGRITDIVLPWIATIFIKNGTSDQFQYFCDGAVLSKSKIITAARCVFDNSTLNPDDVLLILGKRSLHATGEDEKILRVKSILVHENFTLTGDKALNDLAILELEEPAAFSRSIRPACYGAEVKEIEKAVTTAWKYNGEIAPINFDADKTGPCGSDVMSGNTFCATFGNDVPLCPSYGGIYASRTQNSWSLDGILSGNTIERGICIKKTVTYTAISNYLDWIMTNVNK